MAGVVGSIVYRQKLSFKVAKLFLHSAAGFPDNDRYSIASFLAGEHTDSQKNIQQDKSSDTALLQLEEQLKKYENLTSNDLNIHLLDNILFPYVTDPEYPIETSTLSKAFEASSLLSDSKLKHNDSTTINSQISQEISYSQRFLADSITDGISNFDKILLNNPQNSAPGSSSCPGSILQRNVDESNKLGIFGLNGALENSYKSFKDMVNTENLNLSLKENSARENVLLESLLLKNYSTSSNTDNNKKRTIDNVSSDKHDEKRIKKSEFDDILKMDYLTYNSDSADFFQTHLDNISSSLGISNQKTLDDNSINKISDSSNQNGVLFGLSELSERGLKNSEYQMDDLVTENSSNKQNLVQHENNNKNKVDDSINKKNKEDSDKNNDELNKGPTYHIDNEGVPFISFTYTKRGKLLRHTIRCDIDKTLISEIPSSFRLNNCVYPKAYCNKCDYQGNRWDYETACNDYGWRLAFLNQEQLAGKRGMLQRAVDSYRNLMSGRKNRRISKQQKLMQPEYIVGSGPNGLLNYENPSHVGTSKSNNNESEKNVTKIKNNLGLKSSADPKDNSKDMTIRKHIVSDRGELKTLKFRKTHILPKLRDISETLHVSANSLPKMLLVDVFTRSRFDRIRIKADLGSVSSSTVPKEFQNAHCVYPRAQSTAKERYKGALGRWAFEVTCNEISWKLAWLNQPRLTSKRPVMQKCLDAYRWRLPQPPIAILECLKNTPSVHSDSQFLALWVPRWGRKQFLDRKFANDTKDSKVGKETKTDINYQVSKDEENTLDTKDDNIITSSIPKSESGGVESNKFDQIDESNIITNNNTINVNATDKLVINENESMEKINNILSDSNNNNGLNSDDLSNRNQTLYNAKLSLLNNINVLNNIPEFSKFSHGTNLTSFSHDEIAAALVAAAQAMSDSSLLAEQNVDNKSENIQYNTCASSSTDINQTLSNSKNSLFYNNNQNNTSFSSMPHNIQHQPSTDDQTSDNNETNKNLNAALNNIEQANLDISSNNTSWKNLQNDNNSKNVSYTLQKPTEQAQKIDSHLLNAQNNSNSNTRDAKILELPKNTPKDTLLSDTKLKSERKSQIYSKTLPSSFLKQNSSSEPHQKVLKKLKPLAKEATHNQSSEKTSATNNLPTIPEAHPNKKGDSNKANLETLLSSNNTPIKSFANPAKVDQPVPVNSNISFDTFFSSSLLSSANARSNLAPTGNNLNPNYLLGINQAYNFAMNSDPNFLHQQLINYTLENMNKISAMSGNPFVPLHINHNSSSSTSGNILPKFPDHVKLAPKVQPATNINKVKSLVNIKSNNENFEANSKNQETDKIKSQNLAQANNFPNIAPLSKIQPTPPTQNRFQRLAEMSQPRMSLIASNVNDTKIMVNKISKSHVLAPKPLGNSVNVTNLMIKPRSYNSVANLTDPNLSLPQNISNISKTRSFTNLQGAASLNGSSMITKQSHLGAFNPTNLKPNINLHAQNFVFPHQNPTKIQLEKPSQTNNSSNTENLGKISKQKSEIAKEAASILADVLRELAVQAVQAKRGNSLVNNSNIISSETDKNKLDSSSINTSSNTNNPAMSNSDSDQNTLQSKEDKSEKPVLISENIDSKVWRLEKLLKNLQSSSENNTTDTKQLSNLFSFSAGADASSLNPPALLNQSDMFNKNNINNLGQLIASQAEYAYIDKLKTKVPGVVEIYPKASSSVPNSTPHNLDFRAVLLKTLANLQNTSAEKPILNIKPNNTPSAIKSTEIKTKTNENRQIPILPQNNNTNESIKVKTENQAKMINPMPIGPLSNTNQMFAPFAIPSYPIPVSTPTPIPNLSIQSQFNASQNNSSHQALITALVSKLPPSDLAKVIAGLSERMAAANQVQQQPISSAGLQTNNIQFSQQQYQPIMLKSSASFPNLVQTKGDRPDGSGVKAIPKSKLKPRDKKAKQQSTKLNKNVGMVEIAKKVGSSSTCNDIPKGQ
ncbi:hypothetical protein BB561_000373 [Smittium simulii]|uniref:DUF8032 domain-containing protein n=1 Tax=Smittium simulii TaxID=133385 RepID=A0A2T9YZG9_9FUNG|nr:hypothetical protein BB561_000373 [Smittium simulii]